MARSKSDFASTRASSSFCSNKYIHQHYFKTRPGRFVCRSSVPPSGVTVCALHFTGDSLFTTANTGLSVLWTCFFEFFFQNQTVHSQLCLFMRASCCRSPPCARALHKQNRQYIARVEAQSLRAAPPSSAQPRCVSSHAASNTTPQDTHIQSAQSSEKQKKQQSDLPETNKTRRSPRGWAAPTHIPNTPC